MKKLSFYLGLCLVIIGYTGIYAQNLDDAVRYSYLMPYGDSRFNAVSEHSLVLELILLVLASILPDLVFIKIRNIWIFFYL